MLKEEKLDVFLDAFLDGKKPAQETDLDFWDEKSEPEKNDFWEAQDVLTAPKHKGKLSKRTIASMFLILILIPVTIWIGITLFDDRKYFVISLAIAVYCMLPFFLIFEGRKPQARELLTIAVLVAIAVAGRAAFFMVPSFKPVVAVTIISAVCFGAESGFLVGALSMLSSNMLFGQGPWTPWQMFAAGIIGFLAGILFQKEKGLYSDKKICSELELMTAKYPRAIFARSSAYYYYGLTDIIPDYYCLTTKREDSRIKDKRVKQSFVNDDLYDIGKCLIEYQSVKIPIYSRERLLVDLIRFRGRIPFDYYKDVIGNYRRIINDMDFFSMEDYAEKVKGGKKIMDAIQLEVL